MQTGMIDDFVYHNIIGLFIEVNGEDDIKVDFRGVG
jgi:hypothetical protein